MVILLVVISQWENEDNSFPKDLFRAQEAFPFHAHCLTSWPHFASVSTCNTDNSE